MIGPIAQHTDLLSQVGSSGSVTQPSRANSDEAYLSALSNALDEASDSEGLHSLMDRVQGSDTNNVMAQVDQVLNLGEGFGDLHQLSREELAESFAVLTELFERGIVGYEYREVNGERQKVFIDVAIGSDLHRAPLYKNGRLDSYM